MFGVLALFAVGCSSRPMGGDTGWKVYGPAGPEGVAGLDGPAGPAGPAGAPGMAGPAGPAGSPGLAGLSGQPGLSGGQGSQGAAARWESFKDILFDFDRSNVRTDERDTIKQIVQFMKEHPTFEVGLEGYADPRGTDASTTRPSASGGSRPSATPWWPAEPRRTGFESAPKERSTGIAAKTPRGASRRIAGWKCSCGPMRVRQRGNGSERHDADSDHRCRNRRPPGLGCGV